MIFRHFKNNPLENGEDICYYYQVSIIKELNMATIGENIKAAREEAKLSQLQVAVSLGVSDKTISGYESNRISPPIDKLQKLADLFKKPVTFFLGEDTRSYKVSSRLRAVEIQLRDIRRDLREIKALSQNVNLDI